MCPDRQIISLYLDGELPSPWNEKMKSHLASCPECQTIYNDYGGLREKLGDLGEDYIKTAQDRVWEKLSAAEEWNFKPSRRRSVVNRSSLRIWRGSVTLPLPVAAAAAVLIIVAFFALLGIRNNTSLSAPAVQDSVTALNIGLDDQGIVPVTDMNGVLRYLSSQDNGDFMVIRLPETKNFSRAGDPALINAADYSRRNSTGGGHQPSRASTAGSR